MAIRVRDYDPNRDAARVERLWREIFGQPRGGQSVGWLFRPGPAGEAPRAVAEFDGRVVAHAGGAPLRFRLAGEQVRGAYSVAAMTDPAVRGQRLFFRVAEHLYARLEEEGFAFVAGFSNERSHRLMTGPLRRTPLRPFPWAIRPLRPLAAAGALLRRLEAREAPSEASPVRLDRAGVQVGPCAPDDPRLDALWARTAPEVSVGAVRDAAFVRWRFAERPDAAYRLFLAEDASGPVGYAAYRTLPMRGIVAGFMADLLVAPGAPAAARLLLQATHATARADGAHLMSALLPGSGATRTALRAAAYLRVPESLHPQLIRFSVRGLGRWAGRPELTDSNAWLISWADTDVV